MKPIGDKSRCRRCHQCHKEAVTPVRLKLGLLLDGRAGVIDLSDITSPTSLTRARKILPSRCPSAIHASPAKDTVIRSTPVLLLSVHTAFSAIFADKSTSYQVPCTAVIPRSVGRRSVNLQLICGVVPHFQGPAILAAKSASRSVWSAAGPELLGQA